jgi:Methyltransferase domain/Glycosyl transferase family 2
LRILDQERLILSSGLFDPDWYLSAYPEVGAVGNALNHYLETGARKGFDPGPGFSTAGYLEANPDVREKGLNPLVHYVRFGRAEGRETGGAERIAKAAAPMLGNAALARVREEFDSGFYRATNPDLAEDVDAFEHFMRTGWKERRDPAPGFSTEHYLLAHGDVAETGLNPFVHFVNWGCGEGRETRPSRRPRLTVGPDERPTGKLRTVAVVMVKNEADIIRRFAEHLLALFDDIVIVDHQSEDGTLEFIEALAAQNQRLNVLRLNEPSYIQSVTMTHVIRSCDVVREADWVFFLDADEFLPFANPAAFHAALEPLAQCPVIAMNWRNLIPAAYWTGTVEIDETTVFLEPPEPSPFRKIAFQPNRVSLDRVVVAQGNHALCQMLNGQEIEPFDAGFSLLHIPVRSVDQLVIKLNQGVQAYQKIGRTRDAGQGTHWYQMKEATAALDLTADILNGVVEGYSEDKATLRPRTADRLIAGGHRKSCYALARQPISVENLPRRSLGELLMRITSRDFSEAASQDRVGATRLITTDDGWLQRVAGERGVEYARLPLDRPETSDDPARAALLKDILRPGYWSIADLMPCDWTDHIPFIFALAALERPRRFVELGTLRGSSFLAFCQAARQAGFESEAIAVSAWSVDPENEAAYRTAFDDFRFIASKYDDFASWLKMDHAEAALRFDEGSVDLLHLDGFRDYDALKSVLDTWLPKVSSRGVLLLHDTNSHGQDFGVWRVWEELRERFPTLEFRHGQGLGVACVGDGATGPVARLASWVESDPEMRTLFQHHFEQLGRMSAELFSRRFDMARSDNRGRSEGLKAEELTWLRQELASAKTENEDLRGLLNKEVRRVADL